MPELDPSIFGECQAMVLNFDEMLEKEFGTKYCIRESLSFSLQLFPSAQSLAEAVKTNPSGKPIADFIQQYRSSISPEVAASGKFSFKAFLIQVANHSSTDTLPIQFVNYDKLPDDQKTQLSQFVVAVKSKQVPVSNLDLMKPSAVVQRVQTALGNPRTQRGSKEVNKFNESIHSKCWKKYKIRPDSKSPNPEHTDSKYCVWDAAHRDYLYTSAWVDLLAKKLSDQAEFDSLYKISPSVPGAAPVFSKTPSSGIQHS